MELSYWEYKSWLTGLDFTVAGSGITGLNCALELRKRFPEANILVLERGFLPYGASTRNAGFASFGSLSEILDDLQHHSEEEVFDLVKQRFAGLQILRENLGDRNIGFKSYGSSELFALKDEELMENCTARTDGINKLLNPIFGRNPFELKKNIFGFEGIHDHTIFNKAEGQIDSGKMMFTLLKKAVAAGIKILNGITVEAFTDGNAGVNIRTDKFEFTTGKFLIATNGLASQLGITGVKPARAQVLITKPVKGLKIKGTFHIDRGYYYFRNVDERILLGGGRNLDFKTEETAEMEQNPKIQDKLENLLKLVILPGVPVEVEQRWTGIMGMGEQKKPIVRQISENVFCGVRLGGIGIAIGSITGKELAALP